MSPLETARMFPVTDQLSQASRRSLKTAAEPSLVPTLSGRQLGEQHEERRRMNVFAGALLTSGSFTMMASSTLF